MERLSRIQKLGQEILPIVKPLIPGDIRNNPLFRGMESFLPGLGIVLESIEWWGEQRTRKKVPKKAIELVCTWYELEPQVFPSSADLKIALEKKGVKNPEHVWERAINQLFAELKHPELVRFLSSAQTTALEQIETLFAQFKRDLQLNFLHLRPIEQILEALPEGEGHRKPRFFRKTGPEAVDFDEGCIYRRSEVDKVKTLFFTEEAILLSGTAASGKSVIARQIAYEAFKEGWVVYSLSLSELDGFPRGEVQAEISHLAKNYATSLVLIEDVHIAPKEIDTLLGFRQPDWPKILLTSRPVDWDSLFHKIRSELKQLVRVDIDKFDSVEKIIQMFCSAHNLEADEDLIIDLKRASGNNLWLLAYALEAYKSTGGERIDRNQILKEVEKDLLKIESENTPLHTQLLIALSVFFRYEIFTDERFLKDVFGPGATQALLNLVKFGEAIRVLKDRHTFYGLPHSTLAEVYYEFAFLSRWEHSIYQSPEVFVRNYIKSGKAANLIKIMGSSDLIKNKQDIENINFEALTNQIQKTSSVGAVSNCIKTINKINTKKAAELADMLDLKSLARSVETYSTLATSSFFIDTVLEAKPPKAKELVAELDIGVIAEKISNSRNVESGSSGGFIQSVLNADESKGTEIISAINPEGLARIIQQAIVTGNGGGVSILLEAVGTTVGTNILSFLDWNEIAILIEESEDLWGIPQLLKTIRIMDPSSSNVLCQNFNATRMAAIISRENNIYLVSQFLNEAFFTCGPAKVAEICNFIDALPVARAIEDTGIYTQGDMLEALQRANPEKAKEVFQEINSAFLAQKLQEVDGTSWAYRVINCLGKLTPSKAAEICSLLDTNRFANLLIKERVFLGAGNIVQAISEVNQEKAIDICNEFEIDKIADKVIVALNCVTSKTSESGKALVYTGLECLLRIIRKLLPAKASNLLNTLKRLIRDEDQLLWLNKIQKYWWWEQES